jgi:hypothetical protein
MATDKRKQDAKLNTALAALSQAPYQISRGTNFSTMGLRWDEYLFLRETGKFIEARAGASAPDVAITPLGVVSQTWP